MKWDQDGISVCELHLPGRVIAAAELLAEGNFYRVAIPQDILEGIPNPALWPNPTATLEPAGCNPLKYFVNHSIIFGASRLILSG
jgi:hypothetical protein